MLEQQLKIYDDRLKTRQKSKSTRTDLIAYSAMALGATIAVPDAAIGAIVHHTTSVVLNNTAGNTFNIDLDGAGGSDWSLYIGGSSASHFTSGGLGSTIIASAKTAKAVNLAPAATVSSAQLFNGGSGGLWFNTAGTLPFVSNTTGYLGIKFNGDTGTVGAQYAWIKVRFNKVGANITMTLLEWAYQDDGTGIAVGDTGAPAVSAVSADIPSSYSALTLLGLGAAGLAAFRRRRDKELAKKAA